MKLIPIFFYIAVFVLIEWQERKENKKFFTKKKEKPIQLDLFEEKLAG